MGFVDKTYSQNSDVGYFRSAYRVLVMCSGQRSVYFHYDRY